MSGPSVKIPADWLDSDRIEDLGADTIMLMLTALGYSAEQTTDGVVPRRQVRKFWQVDDVGAAIDQLIRAGEVEDRGDVLLFVNWRDFILDAEQVEEIRSGNRERAERSRRHRKGDHAMCRASYCRDAPRDSSRDQSHHGARESRTSDPIRSDPTAREEKEKGGEAGAAGAAPPAANDPEGFDQFGDWLATQLEQGAKVYDFGPYVEQAESSMRRGLKDTVAAAYEVRGGTWTENITGRQPDDFHLHSQLMAFAIYQKSHARKIGRARR